jgi:hypothetical protein
MKKILFISVLLLLSASAYSQNRVAQFSGTATNNTVWASQTLQNIAPSGNNGIQVVNKSATAIDVWFCLSAADTTAASSGLSKYVTVSQNGNFIFPFSSADRVYYRLASAGTATIQIIKY